MVVLGIGSAAATAIVAVAWLGSAAVGIPAAAPLTSAIQSMIGILGTSGAAAW